MAMFSFLILQLAFSKLSIVCNKMHCLIFPGGIQVINEGRLTIPVQSGQNSGLGFQSGQNLGAIY